jgi:hypothetical protein
MYTKPRYFLIVAPLILAIISACATRLSKTPVRGPSTSIVQLAGEWEGTYSSEQTGRVGSILFRLRATSDSAECDVLMTPRRALETNETDLHRLPPQATGTNSELLSIRFVRIAGNEVTGILDPYRDPECGCNLYTTFIGILRGDTIEGTFRSEGDGIHHLSARGKWRVTRKSGP